MSQLKDIGRIYVLIFGMMLIVMSITTAIESIDLLLSEGMTTTIEQLLMLSCFLIIPGTIIVLYVFRKEADATARQLQQQTQIQPQKVQDYTAPPYEAAGIFKGFFKRKTYDTSAPPATPIDQMQTTQIRPLVSVRSTLDIPGVKILFLIFILAIALGAFCLSLYGGSMLAYILFPISFVVAFTFPSLMWISYIYHKDIYEPEPRRAILTILAWGMFSVVPAIILEMFVDSQLSRIAIAGAAIIYGALFVPIIEEFWKAAGIPKVKKEIDGELDGIIYGITAGMGFAMVENMMYEFSFIFNPETSAAELWTLGALVRGLSSTAIHAVCSGLIGYGYGHYLYKKPKSITPLIGAYIAAIILHGIWNGSLTIFDEAGVGWTSWVFIATFPLFIFLILRHYVTKGVDSDRERYKVPYSVSNSPPEPQDVNTPPEIQREI